MQTISTAIRPGTAVDVYWNLHKHCFSVRARRGNQRGRVIGHADNVTITNAVLVVNEAGRDKVRAEGKKNVHAFIRGTWTTEDWGLDETAITYNPYVNDTFVVKATGVPVGAAEVVNGRVRKNDGCVTVPVLMAGGLW